MSRPDSDTVVESVDQWVYRGECTFTRKLQYKSSSYGYGRSLICVAEFDELKYSYRVYFSCSSTHQIMPGYISTADFLPIFRIDPGNLNTVNCRGDKCRREFGPETGIWCTACHGDPDESAGMVIDCLIKRDFTFGDIPDDCIIHVKRTKRDRYEVSERASDLKDKIADAESKVAPGGYYDVKIRELTDKINAERAETLHAITKWRDQIESISDSGTGMDTDSSADSDNE